MPDQEQVQEPEAASGDEEYVPGEDTGTEEMYSAQLLRQLHDDAGRLLERYDSLLSPLEHDAIRKFVEGYCEFLDSQMTAIEGHMQEHHPDLQPLDGMEPAASEDEEDGEATPEEAAEASAPKDKSEDEEEEEPEGGEKSLTPEQVKELRGKHKALPTPPVVGESALAGDEDAVEVIDNAEEQANVNFEPHEMDSLTEAHGFLSGVVNQQDPWGSIHRHEAYHHSRCLGKIATLGDAGHVPGDEEFEQMDADGMDREVKGGSSYYRDANGRAIRHDAEPSMGKTRAMQILNARSDALKGKKPTPGDEGKMPKSAMPRGGEGNAAVAANRLKKTKPGKKDLDEGDDKGTGMEVLPNARESQFKSPHHEKVGKAGQFLELLATLNGDLRPEDREGADGHARGLAEAMGSDNGGEEKGGEQVVDEAPPAKDGDEMDAEGKVLQQGNRGGRVLRKPANLRNDDTALSDDEAPATLAQRRGHRESAIHRVRGSRPQEEYYTGDTKALMDETNEQRATVLEFNKKIVELAKKLG